MKKLLMFIIAATLVFGLAGSTSATMISLTGSVDLNGSNFIQSGSVTNTSGLVMTDFIYSLGTAEDYVATWEHYAETGTASDFFGTSWFQTITWSGLNIQTNQTWSFSGLDIDLIIDADAGTVSHSILDDGGYNSLRNASVTAIYSDGSMATAMLIGDAGWRGTHDYDLNGGGGAPVPEPSTILLMGAGLLGLVGFNRKRFSKKS